MAKYRTIAGIERIVYDSMEEFKESNPGERVNLDWRKGRKGDWVLADDGSVMEVLKHGRVSSSSPREFIRTVAGTFAIWEKGRLDSNFRENIYSFGGTFSYNPRLSYREKAFVSLILLGFDPVDAFLKIFKIVDLAKARARAHSLMAKGAVMRAIKEGIETAGAASGATLEWAMKSVKGTVEKSKSDSIKLKGAGMILEIHTKEDSTPANGGLLGAFAGFPVEELPPGETKQIEQEASQAST